MRAALPDIAVWLHLSCALAVFTVAAGLDIGASTSSQVSRATGQYVTIDDEFLPRLHVNKHGPECDNGQYIIAAPLTNPFPAPHNTLAIYDTTGELVLYQGPETLPALLMYDNADIQHYKGKPYLVYFEGTGFLGHGDGMYFMLDEAYNTVRTFSAHGHVDTDLHEFTITDQNTALLTAYVLVPADLSRYGVLEDGKMWDSLFQEIDLETGELIFEWRASHHFSFDDMAIDSYWRVANDSRPYHDWYHINSVEKDPKGNYLISGRYACAVSYIDGTTGEVIWNLGGRNSSFKDLTPPEHGNASTALYAQHMARWVDNYTAITLFDNQAWWGEARASSRVLKIGLDLETMTSQVLVPYEHPSKPWCEYGGSVSTLSNGNLFVGYGAQTFVSEYSRNGSLLCDYSLEFSGLPTPTGPTPGQGYRTYKRTWNAQPQEPPRTAIARDNTLFVSWNGATEVRAWALDAAMADGSVMIVGRTPKQGFESSLPLRKTAGLDVQLYRLRALDTNDSLLGTWYLDALGQLNTTYQAPPASDDLFKIEASSTKTRMLLAVGVILAVLVAISATARKGVQGAWRRCSDLSLPLLNRIRTESTSFVPPFLKSKARWKYADVNYELIGNDLEPDPPDTSTGHSTAAKSP